MEPRLPEPRREIPENRERSTPSAPVTCLTVVIRGFERRLERMVEGAFSRAFRSSIRPVELARRLAREMDDRVSVGVRGGAVVPNHFTVILSSTDYHEFQDVRDALRRELCDAARAHARDEHYGFMGPVEMELVVDESFRTGWFEIEGHFREGAGGAGAGSLVLPTGDRFTLGEHPISIGRRPESNIVLADPNVSRNHAEIRPHGEGFLLVDLGSTNGTKVNGVRVEQRILADGDEITFGSTSLHFEAS